MLSFSRRLSSLIPTSAIVVVHSFASRIDDYILDGDITPQVTRTTRIHRIHCPNLPNFTLFRSPRSLSRSPRERSIQIISHTEFIIAPNFALSLFTLLCFFSFFFSSSGNRGMCRDRRRLVDEGYRSLRANVHGTSTEILSTVDRVIARISALDCDGRDWASPREAVPSRVAHAPTALLSPPRARRRSSRSPPSRAPLRAVSRASRSFALSFTVSRAREIHPALAHAGGCSLSRFLQSISFRSLRERPVPSRADPHPADTHDLTPRLLRAKGDCRFRALRIQFVGRPRKFLLNTVCYASSFARH